MKDRRTRYEERNLLIESILEKRLVIQVTSRIPDDLNR